MRAMSRHNFKRRIKSDNQTHRRVGPSCAVNVKLEVAMSHLAKQVGPLIFIFLYKKCTNDFGVGKSHSELGQCSQIYREHKDPKVLIASSSPFNFVTDI